MFTKLTLICLAIVPLIIVVKTESPTPTRVGKFYRLFAAHSPLKLLVSANKRWSGELSLSFGRRPLIASGIAAGYEQHLDFPIQQPFNAQSIQLDAPPSNDSLPSNATSASGTDDAESTEAAALNTTTESMQATSRTLKLEDYDEITFDPDVDGNRGRREGTWNVSNVNKRGLRADDEVTTVDLTTTVDSSTMEMNFQDQETVESNFVTMSPPPVHQRPPIYQNFPYPPSRNPEAQHVSITTPPQHPHYLPQVKNYYDFLPSQLDYLHHPMPFCINPAHHKFTPFVHDTWSNYRKWK